MVYTKLANNTKKTLQQQIFLKSKTLWHQTLITIILIGTAKIRFKKSPYLKFHTKLTIIRPKALAPLEFFRTEILKLTV